jgi:SAM-dependent methyltransferase
MFPGDEHLLRHELRSAEDWTRVWFATQAERAFEGVLGAQHADDAEWSFPAWCDVCQCPSSFTCDWVGSEDHVVPDTRERLSCSKCALNTRQRLVMMLTLEIISPLVRKYREGTARFTPAIYAYEQVTPFYKALRRLFPDVQVVGSEYLGPGVPARDELNGLRHEDAQNLSFGDSTFDLILSNEVYEHVPDIRQTLREAQRVLRTGGHLLGTVPFTFLPSTEQVARIEDGQIQYLSTPEYHGNPMSSEGSLVYHRFGWDLLDMLREAGFSDPHFKCVYSSSRAYLDGVMGLVLCATKS